MPLQFIIQAAGEEVDPRLEALANIFWAALVCFVLLYVFFAVASLVVLLFASGRTRRVIKGFLAVGPFVVLSVAVTFVLFALQYIAIYGTFKQTVDPGKIFGEATVQIIQDRSEEIRERISSATEKSPDEALKTAVHNYDVMKESGYYRFLSGAFHLAFSIHDIFGLVILAILVVVMFGQLWFSSREMFAFPLRRGVGVTVRDLARTSFRRLLELFFYTVCLGVFFFSCAIAVAALSYFILLMTADLFIEYNVEILVACVQGPASPLAVFLLLFSFTVMMTAVVVLFLAGTALFVLGSARAIRVRCERWTARMLKLPPPEPGPAPRLRITLKTLALFLVKLGICTLIAWFALRVVILSTEIEIGSFLVAVIQVIGFGLLLLFLKVHRRIVLLLSECLTGTRRGERLAGWIEKRGWKRKTTGPVPAPDDADEKLAALLEGPEEPEPPPD